MPIGVPKVPYRIPGEENATYVDLFNRLYRDRTLFLCNELKDELANQLIGIMLFLNGEDTTAEKIRKEKHPEKPPEFKKIRMFINSPGGSVTNGIGVFDAMGYILADVSTIGAGLAASMASCVLSGGQYGYRIALPNARIMIHQPEGGSRGQASEILTETKEIKRLRYVVAMLYVERTTQSFARICLDMYRDTYMSADEAQDYGIVDEVAIDPIEDLWY